MRSIIAPFKTLAATAAIVATLVISQIGWLIPKANAAPTGLPGGFTATTLINHSMIAPTSVRVAPDGRIFVFDLLGTIKIFQPNVGFNGTNFGSVTVDATGDRGLLGATFDRDFANNPYVYVHYVGADDKVRIGRFTASTDTGTNFTVLYTAPTASGFQHAGGGITMGPDNRIYFGIGDSGTPTNSQDLQTINGKLHRINRDGSVPVNPFAGQPGVADTIYAYGVRNPFRLTTDAQTGTIYLGDVGFNTWEEINVVQPGKNYGWATQEGPCTSACPYENPVHWYPHQFSNGTNTNDASIVAGPVYRGNAYPASYKGKMFISDYVQGFIRLIDPTISSDAFSTFSTGNGSVIDMDVGPDGKLYFITINSPTLYRLDFTSGSTNVPPTAQSGANKTTGDAPLTVNFNSTGSSDPEGQNLSYNWTFGDGTTSTQANPTKTYSAEGQYTAQLTVGDGVNTTPATPITIKVGTLPTITITSPTATAKYNGGQTISYSANAIDSHGAPIPDGNLKTTVRLYHSDHSHPFLGPLTGGSGQFVTPTNGELSPDVWLRITVEATDANGIIGSSYVEIQPNKATITVNTNPAGLNVVLDGSNHIIPPTVQGVVGVTRQVAAPSPQTFNGVQYVFSHWSDGGAQDHTFSFPNTNTTYTANYVPASGGGTQMSNVAPNPSFETLGTNNLPTSWTGSRWGTNNATYASSTDAHTGSRSVKLEATTYTSGEMRLYHTAVPLASGTVHGVQYFYKSNVQTKAVADVTLNDGTHKYIWLGISQPSATYKEQNWALTTPVNTKNVIVNLYLVSAGYFVVDDFALMAPSSGGTTPPAVTAPAITLSATPTTITAGSNSMLTWSTTGTTPTCAATGGWSGAQAVSGTLSVQPGATTTYTLTCANSAGSDSKSVTVTVNPTTPGPSPATGNIVPNPSFEIESPTLGTTDWKNDKWGVNSAVSTVVHGDAVTGDHSVRTDVTSFTSGEARWYFTPQTIAPNTLYTYSVKHKSSGPTKVLVDVTLTDNTHKYYWLGTLPTAADWATFTKTFTAPANAKNATVSVYMTGAGFFQIDDTSLTPPAPVTPVPVLAFSATPTNIAAGQSTTLNWSTTGNPACTASDGWAGSQAANGSLVVSPTITTTYSLACANSAGTAMGSVTVTVTPTDPGPGPGSNPSPNLIANPSLLDAPVGATIPTFWYQGMWGTNTTVFGHDNVGRTDGRSISITMSNRVDGDAKWFFEPVAVTEGATYNFSHWYKATADTELLVEYTLGDGSKSYIWLGFVPAATIWAQTTHTLTAPVGATKVTVHHILKNNGTLQLDDYSLVKN